MDQTLDDIISAKPRARRGGRRSTSGRQQILGKPVVSPVTRAATSASVARVKAPVAQASPADKIIVSNLPQDVNEAQIKELFSSTVGLTKDVTLHYDSAGRSKGVAAVHFQKKGDGTKAYTQYNNRLIDGKRPMKIEIIVDPARPLSLASRVAPAAAVVATNGSQVPRTGGGARRRGRGGGRGAGRARRTERLPKSAADLDAEMEDYTASNAPTAATA